MSIRLYVGNLPKEVERQEFDAMFADFEGMISTKVITDRKTGKCRGFGFVTVKTEENAEELIEKFNGYMFKETPLKIERAQPRNKGKGEEDGEAAVATASPSSSSSGGKRKGKGSNSKRGGSSDSDSVQPDPRWAQELEKLKELLATQTANS
jgi:RNA recognition motif-containing protein